MKEKFDTISGKRRTEFSWGPTPDIRIAFVHEFEGPEDPQQFIVWAFVHDRKKRVVSGATNARLGRIFVRVDSMFTSRFKETLKVTENGFVARLTVMPFTNPDLVKGFGVGFGDDIRIEFTEHALRVWRMFAEKVWRPIRKRQATKKIVRKSGRSRKEAKQNTRRPSPKPTELNKAAVRGKRGIIVSATNDETFIIRTVWGDQVFKARVFCFDVSKNDSVRFTSSTGVCVSNTFVNLRSGAKCDVWCE